ncbi:hypothetical protein [Arundinibacter roseus]|uniref:Uncharacterized protein n=1 Tax=Arundinibacter roseus TaxID=2070510 RepID=A0A4R4KBP3_9BACT|nr:hypothetical protein [Arundinibacter roseus]TDB65208.1 hypothetical protein EZE20_10905 [Arundinibacter roseus]
MKTLFILSDWCYTHLTTRRMLLFLVLVIGINVLLFPALQTKMGQGAAADVLDLHIGFTKAEAMEVLTILGENGRQIYLWTELLADGIYPILYTLLFLSILSLIYKKILFPASYWRWINLVPLFILLADYLENVGIITLITTFPNFSDPVVWLTSAANQIKWGATLITSVVLLVGVGLLLFRKKPLTPLGS